MSTVFNRSSEHWHDKFQNVEKIKNMNMKIACVYNFLKRKILKK